jgi:hypothetical protein
MNCDELWWIAMKVGKIRKDQESSWSDATLTDAYSKHFSMAEIFRAVPQFLASSRERILHAGYLTTYESPKPWWCDFRFQKWGCLMLFEHGVPPLPQDWAILENCGIAMVCHGIPVAVLFIGQTFPPLVALRKVSPCFLFSISICVTSWAVGWPCALPILPQATRLCRGANSCDI